MNRVLPVVAVALLTVSAAAVARASDEVRLPAPVSRFEQTSLPRFTKPDLVPFDEADEEGAPEPTAESLASGLEPWLAEMMEAAGGEAWSEGDDLVLKGPAEAVARARELVAAVDAYVNGPVVLKFSVVHLRDRADSADVRAAVRAGRGAVVFAERLRIARLEPAVRERLDHRLVLVAVSTEVAENAATSDPEPGVLRTGLRAGARVRALAGRSAAMEVSMQLSRLEEIQAVRLSWGEVDLPRVRFASIAAPVVLAVGETAVLTVAHPWEDGDLAVVMELLEVPVLAAMPFTLVDLGDAGDPDEALGRLPEEAVRLTSTLAALPLGTETAQTFLRECRWVTRRTWDVSAADILADEHYDPLDGTVDRAALGGALLPAGSSRAAFRLPVATGTDTVCVSGTWRRVISDYSVEIASGAATTQPFVEAVTVGDVVHLGRSASGVVTARWSASRVVRDELRALVVRRDIGGERVEEERDRLSAFESRVQSGLLVVDPAQPLQARRSGEGERYEIDAWE